MKCPIDQSDLVMAERQGIEIDYCPKCRGVWLDRGELDKIVERAAGDGRPAAAASRPAAPAYPERPDHRARERRYDDDRGYGGDHYRHKKRKSFLGELFDFD